MRKNKFDVIVCPCCGAEYLPAEIYVSNSYIGTPKHIIKNDEGKILTFDGETMNTSETYQCDYCNSKFIINAKTTFLTEIKTSKDFDTEFVSKRYQKIDLCED